jgi:putative glycerol-1-phosphate prenyltransferase
MLSENIYQMRPINFPGDKSVALLLDPDKSMDQSLKAILETASGCKTDYIMAGGSIAFRSIDNLIYTIKKHSNIPVVLFPGNLLQLSLEADIILLLSLISGRNPELLIGNHVIAAPYLKDVRKKLVPTGYILVNRGSITSVEYMSQTGAIPADKPEIVIATAMAGEMLGLGMIYLEAGSGALNHVPPDIIRAVKENINIPLVVGGGIRTGENVEDIFKAGADMVVLGNGCERNPDLLVEACNARDKLRAGKKISNEG